MKNIDRFVSNVSQCILQPLNVLILILNGTKICMITVSAKCKQVSHRVVLRKNSNAFSMIFLENSWEFWTSQNVKTQSTTPIA